MKSLKRAASLLLAFAFVLFTMAPAFATKTEVSRPEDGFTIEIKDAPVDQTYSAYQIFKGDLAQEEGGNLILSNIEWGSGVVFGEGEESESAFYDKLATLGIKTQNADGTEVTCKSAREVAEALSRLAGTVNNTTGDPQAGVGGFDNDKAQAFADAIAPYLKGTAKTSEKVTADPAGSKTGTATIGDLDAGYYLVQTTDVAATDGAATRYMLEVVGNVTAKAKSAVPSVEKKVKDINDSTEKAEGDWQDSADHDIGDHVSFQLKGTLPSNYTDYEDYVFEFHDTLSDGLTYDAGSIKVYKVKLEKDGTFSEDALELVAEDKYTFAAPDPNTDTEGNHCSLAVKFADLKDVISDTEFEAAAKEDEGYAIVVRYTAKLNENAVVGPTGNTNDVYLKYSNNPNEGGNGTSETPKDKVVVFTYELDVDKVQPNGAETQPLNGAGFTLLKETTLTATDLPDGTEPVAYEALDDAEIGDYYQADGKIYEVVGQIGPEDDLHLFEFKGLDDGSYLVVESTVPAGFNKADDIKFTITATHDEEAAEPKLLTFKAEGDNEINVTEDEAGETKVTGKFTTKVLNQQGAQLPETGGIGTTIFYVVGGVLVVGAVVLLVTKKRMNN